MLAIASEEALAVDEPLVVVVVVADSDETFRCVWVASKFFRMASSHPPAA